MWETLMACIDTTLDKITGDGKVLSVHYGYPKSDLSEYPAVIYLPGPFNNDFATNVENYAIYRFNMYVVVGVEATTEQHAFSDVLAGAVDAIVEQFDEDWNQGTIDGHRVRVKVDSADAWQMNQEDDGLVCYAPLNVEFRLLTTY
jgi:predicted PilT family ATPase